MAELLKGAPVAAALLEELAPRAARLGARGIVPCLALLRVGERPGDLTYERGIRKRCEKLGIRVVLNALPADCTQAALLDVIAACNADPSVHGALLFRPLPPEMDEQFISQTLRSGKDVDGMSDASLGMVFTGRGHGFAPCTAQSCLEILDHYGIELSGRHVVVLGRSLVVGRPVAMLLQRRNATVTLCHSHSVDVPVLCRGADILISAMGQALAVDARYTHPAQVIVDVGVNSTPDGGICGDVDMDAVEPLVRAVTPVPGGVGSVTTAVLCKHVIEAAERSLP